MMPCMIVQKEDSLGLREMLQGFTFKSWFCGL